MEDIILIRRVKDNYGWMGNMAPYPVILNGKTWRTTEALFQAMRFKENTIPFNLIHQATSPMTAKMIAKANCNEMIIESRSALDLINMETVLMLKILQHPSLKDELLNTGTRPIIEDCSARPNESGLFWGAQFKDNKWIGENHLGRLWMKLRSEL